MSNSESEKSLVNINAKIEGISDLAKHGSRSYNNTLKAISLGISAIWKTVEPALKAKVDRSVKNTQADTVIDLIQKSKSLEQNNLELVSVEDRAMYRLANDAVRNQENRESIVHKLLEKMSQHPPEIDAKSEISSDWVDQFWRFCEKISENDVQDFYAKLLSSEIKKPGSISPLTLSSLSVLTPEIAKKFQNFCCLSFDDKSDVFIIHPNVFTFMNYGPLEEYGVSQEDVIDFVSYGFIVSSQTTLFNYSAENVRQEVDYAGQEATLNLAGIQTNEIKFTRVGRELRRILSLQPISNFTDAMQKKLGSAFVIL